MFAVFPEHHVSVLPSIYLGNIYDLGGFSVGVVERSQILPCGADVVAGDVVIGLPSSGLHSNGFSLVRHVVEHHKLRYDMPSPFDQRLTLGRWISLCGKKTKLKGCATDF